MFVGRGGGGEGPFQRRTERTKRKKTLRWPPNTHLKRKGGSGGVRLGAGGKQFGARAKPCPAHGAVTSLPARAAANAAEQKALAKQEGHSKAAVKASAQVQKAQTIEVSSKKRVKQAKLDHDAKAAAVHAQARHESAKKLAVKAKGLEMEGRKQDQLATLKKAKAKSEKGGKTIALKARGQALIGDRIFMGQM